MHSAFFFLLDLDDDAPISGPELMAEAVSVFEDRYGSVLDENNWCQPILICEKDGQSQKAAELEGPAMSFHEAWHAATISVVHQLAIIDSALSGEQGPVFLDLNPFSLGVPGQDQALVENLSSEQISQLISERGAAYLAESYRQLADHQAYAPNLLESYQRGCFARCFEFFKSADQPPFSDSFPSPYQYSAVDLRTGPSARQAILVVDIHT